MSDSVRVGYDINVMARLRFPLPTLEQDSAEAEEAATEAAWDDRRDFADELQRSYDEQVANADFDADGAVLPNVLVDELLRVSWEVEQLERYRDRLIVFARSLASRTVPARTIARWTGMSHSTIVRMATVEAIEEVAAEAAPAAAAALTRLDPSDDPELYLRLKQATRVWGAMDAFKVHRRGPQ